MSDLRQRLEEIRSDKPYGGTTRDSRLALLMADQNQTIIELLQEIVALGRNSRLPQALNAARTEPREQMSGGANGKRR